MDEQATPSGPGRRLDRRAFLVATSAIGAGIVIEGAPASPASAPPPPPSRSPAASSW
ncbi:hypothetical protein [Actinacidiphila oryziradicis]|uniref:hypothetical protein n=1 Tax=Actinacidiphila oryziradicis TaxID=2571141 RepID=UPI00145FBD77|nr:hypothetical protein [Actinacidiphila oryziradicis]